MILRVDGIDFFIRINEADLNSAKIPILLLHGFSGCSDDWEFLINKIPSNFLPIAIDLIGHGFTESPEDSKFYTACSIVNQINNITEQLNFEKFIICGYSLGGRAAISYMCKFPNKVIAAILESSTAGIESIEDKKERVELDYLLADKIKSEGINSFMDFWFQTPLFERLKNLSEFNQLKNKRQQNSVIGLSNMIAGFSTGLMQSCWDKLGAINSQVLLISGENDPKYCGINQNLAAKLVHSQHKIIKDAGHNVHLEMPDVFTKLVLDFLNNLEINNELQLENNKKV
jgi:2-succinyl-6-hydroxy-2,4-cyclohexadiene-1-carboxylate synthase